MIVPDGVFRNAFQAGDISMSQAGSFDLNTGKIYIGDNPAYDFENAPGLTSVSGSMAARHGFTPLPTP
jgi:hypothetical protein